jgi:hypothetical protein
MRRPVTWLCVAVAAVLFVACSGSGGNAATPTTRPAAPVTLTAGRACMSAEVWGVSSDGTIGLGVVTTSSQPSSDQPSVIHFDASSDAVDFIAYKGEDLNNQLCGGSGQPTAERIAIVSGSGTLALDALGPLPMGGRLTTTEVVLSDGTVIAPMDLTANCIGCFPS